VLATDDVVFNRMVSARVYGSDVNVRFTTMSASHYYLGAIRNLSDGALLAAVRAAGPTSTGSICSPLGFAPSAAHVLGFQLADSPSAAGSATTGTMVVGFYQAGSLVWSSPAPGLSLVQDSVLENDLGWGLGLDDGTLRLMIPLGSGPLTIADQGATYAAHSAVGWGNLVVSNPALGGSLDEVIRAWDPNHPSHTIVAQPDTDIPVVALSDSAMAWVGVQGQGRWNGTYSSAELYWAPLPAGQDSIPVMGSAPLTQVGGSIELQTWGDYAAVLSADQTKKRLVATVVRRSDGRVWTLAPRSGAVFMRLLAVSPTEIIFGENDDSGDPALASQMQYLTRYELAQLDSLATAL
jgi:hypothetical protein